MTPRPPVDPGLQAERTLLSWRRTALLVLGCSLLVARATGPVSALSATLVGIGVLTVVQMFRISARRYPSNRAAVDDSSPRGAARVGGSLLYLSIAASSIGVLGTVTVVLP